MKVGKIKLNKIYCMDCLEGMKKIPDNTIDLIVTSPPYNIGINYDVYNDTKPWNEYLNWCREWLKECFRILKDDGRICINHYIAFRDLKKQGRFPLMDIRNIMIKIGFKVDKIIIWEDKSYSTFTAWGSWMSASSPYIQTPYEGILVGYKKQWKKLNKGISTINKKDFVEGVGGIWKLGTDTKQLTKCCFPISLPKRCIELLTYKNDLVLDPFMGSGTTAVAAKQTNRNFVGFEISKEYCKIANKRLEQENINGWLENR